MYNSRRHASQLVTLLTLFGLPPRFDLKGKRLDRVLGDSTRMLRVISHHGGPELAVEPLSPEEIREIMAEVDLLRFARVPRKIASASDLVWQGTPDNSYVALVDRHLTVGVSRNVLGRCRLSPGFGAQ